MAQADPESRPLASGAPQPLVERRCGPAWGLEPEKYCGQGGDPGTKRAPPLLPAFHPGGAASCRRGWPLLTELHCSAGGGVPGANRGCRGSRPLGELRKPASSLGEGGQGGSADLAGLAD